mmetsp:Transcript_13007/g.32876  ORF Transcript_13007/g.32876 Transcript_13007/m.32876 type:complete len:171 (+) Transcript_13007:161-673(+)
MKLLRAAAQVLTAVPVAVVLHDCVFTVCRVPDPSMAPTLQGGGEYVFVDKFSIRSWMAPCPELRGEVVYLRSPNEPDKVLLKRVVGIPGDWISDWDSIPLQVPKGHCWVEGDDKKSNRTNRFQKHFAGGLVPFGLIQGEVRGIVWPPNRLGKVERNTTTNKRFYFRRTKE